jgi:hypothetical protein
VAAGGLAVVHARRDRVLECIRAKDGRSVEGGAIIPHPDRAQRRSRADAAGCRQPVLPRAAWRRTAPHPVASGSSTRGASGYADRQPRAHDARPPNCVSSSPPAVGPRRSFGRCGVRERASSHGGARASTLGPVG